MHLFWGIDWAEEHHDVALVDDTGALRARAKVPNDANGLRTLLALLADCGDSAEQPIPVAIERPDGLLVASLRATGRPLHPGRPRPARPAACGAAARSGAPGRAEAARGSGRAGRTCVRAGRAAPAARGGGPHQRPEGSPANS